MEHLYFIDRYFELYVRELLEEQSKVRTLRLSQTELFQRKVIHGVARRIQEDPGGLTNLTEVAQDIGYSPDHFSRLFKKHIGSSPKQYLQRSRMNKALHLLLEEDLSVKRISSLLGYSQAHFFSRHFKEATKMSPSAYRMKYLTYKKQA